MFTIHGCVYRLSHDLLLQSPGWPRRRTTQVLHISNDLGRRGEDDVLDGSTVGQVKRQREQIQRKAFLLELDAMIRLRSPYTVNVYGAVTAMQDRLVLVMELLSGGDLRTLLSNCKQPLPEYRSRQIIADICAGMAFLHSKEAIHGDLKSANVLLEGTGRAKVGVWHRREQWISRGASDVAKHATLPGERPSS